MNKTAIITGAGKKRVGRTVAEALVSNGYSVMLHYRTSKADALAAVEEIRKAGGTAVAQFADLASEADVKSLTEAAVKQFGKIDALVHCAAIWNRKLLEDVTAKDVIENFHTNTLSTFLLNQHVGLAMTKQTGGGCIINFGDWATTRPYTGYAAYFPSKAAIPGLTRTFAVELGTRNPKVRVNAILPGPVMLPPDLPEEEKQQAIDATLVKREGSPDHIAKAVLQFLDNDFLTGVCLPVDGGRSIYAGGH